MKNKIFLIFIYTFFVICLCFSGEDNITIDQLVGVWNPTDRNYDVGIAKKFDWGFSKYNPFISLEMKRDKYAELTIFAPGYLLEMRSIKKIDKKKFELLFYAENSERKIEIEFLDNNLIKINNGNLFFDEEIYKKIGGPDIEFNDYYTPKVERLSLRAGASVNDKRIRMLTPEDKLMILHFGKREEINGLTDSWVKVKTSQGEIGWCFFAYLEKIK